MYIFILIVKKKLQGDKIEIPSYVKEHKLKINYSFYISNQIMKPVLQIFALVLEQIPAYKIKKKWFTAKDSHAGTKTQG